MTSLTSTDQQHESVEERYCSLVSKEKQEDPIGSASTNQSYLFIEVSPPWEHKVTESKYFPSGLSEVLAEETRQNQVTRKPPKLLAFTSDTEHSPKGFRRIIYYSRPDFPLTQFEKTEYVVQEEHLIDFVQLLLRQSEEISRFEPYKVQTEKRDLFVCTHGSRDRCCGKFGYSLYQEISERYASDPDLNLRVWRTSHIGGHRYAPTMIDMPEGRYWAHIRSDLLDYLLRRKGEFAALARNYRGWGAIGAFEQAAEREIFIQEGWQWIQYAKKSSVLSCDETKAHVRIEYFLPDSTVAGVYEAKVRVGESAVVGGCGLERYEAKQFVVENLVRR